MTPAEREAFLAERKTMIGGSDAASLFNIGYGCTRRLVMEKRGVDPDYPRESNRAMELGSFLEPYIAARVEEEKGWETYPVDGAVQLPGFPFIAVHVDRFVRAEGTCHEVVLEMKAMGAAAFAKMKRDGMPEDYVLQLQYAMLCVGCSWGAFAVLNRDTGELLVWEVERDDSIGDDLKARAIEVWGMSQDQDIPLPDRLKPSDSRCKKCEYRTSCQGEALMALAKEDGPVERDDSLAEITAEFAEARDIAEQAAAHLEDVKERLTTALGDRTAVDAPGGRFYYRPQERTTVDGKLACEMYDTLRDWALGVIAKHPESWRKAHRFEDEFTESSRFRKSSVSRPLRFFPR